MSHSPDPAETRERLTRELGDEMLRVPDPERDTVEGLLPAAVVRASAEDEVCRVLDAARRLGLAVLPTGSGSRRALGNAPERGDMLLELDGLNAIGDFEPRDQFLVVGAGLPLERAEQIARGEGLTLAADLPVPGPGTVGGAIACGTPGLSRLAARGARHAVIGMRVAHPDGAVTALGTRVPKNVAGLDVAKLHVGALGTLGVITEVTLRLRARPPAEATVLTPVRALADTVASAIALVGEGLLPEVLLLSQPATSDTRAGASLAVRFSGEPERVRWQAETTAKRLDAAILESAEGEAHWQAVSRGLAPEATHDTLVLEVRCLPDRLAKALTSVAAATPHLERRIIAHAASGEARVWLRDGESAPDLATTTRVVTDLRRTLLEHRGTVRLLSAPSAAKREVDVWPDPGTAQTLMRRVKQALDPHRVLNPGRYLCGI